MTGLDTSDCRRDD